MGNIEAPNGEKIFKGYSAQVSNPASLGRMIFYSQLRNLEHRIYEAGSKYVASDGKSKKTVSRGFKAFVVEKCTDADRDSFNSFI